MYSCDSLWCTGNRTVDADGRTCANSAVATCINKHLDCIFIMVHQADRVPPLHEPLHPQEQERKRRLAEEFEEVIDAPITGIEGKDSPVAVQPVKDGLEVANKVEQVRALGSVPATIEFVSQ